MRNFIKMMLLIIFKILLTVIFVQRVHCSFFVEDTIYISNRTKSAFTISWISTAECVGEVYFGSAPDNLTNVAYDIRGQETLSHTHYIKLIDLKEEVGKYYYQVKENGNIIFSGDETLFIDLARNIP